MFESVFANGVGLEAVLAALGTSVGLGALISFVYMFKADYTKGFVITLTVMPAVAMAIILTMNGFLDTGISLGVGTGIALAGAFSLVRFRSVQGGAKEICMVLFAAAIGFSAGIGQLLFALIFTLAISAVIMIIKLIPFGEETRRSDRTLQISISEDLNYTEAFAGVFAKYLKRYKLEKVKTTNMGSMFQLTYCAVLKDAAKEKEFLDELRIINGNLPIVCGVYRTQDNVM